MPIAFAVLILLSQQTPPPAAPAKPFPYALALDAAQAALASCQPAGPAVVEVMDTALNPKVLLVADGSRPNLIEFARRKAYTVIKKGMASGEFGASVGPQGRGAPPIEGDASLITFAGGLPRATWPVTTVSPRNRWVVHSSSTARSV